jgi:hypothetical protein
MALALPLQGMAAAGSWHCTPAHGHMHAAGVGPMPAQSHGQVHAALPDHLVHAAAQVGSQAGDAAPDGAGSQELSGSFSSAKCSACAACCAAAALPADDVRIPVVPGDTFVAPARMAAPLSFVPGGLDRPPRTRLA